MAGSKPSRGGVTKDDVEELLAKVEARLMEEVRNVLQEMNTKLAESKETAEEERDRLREEMSSMVTEKLGEMENMSHEAATVAPDGKPKSRGIYPTVAEAMADMERLRGLVDR